MKYLTPSWYESEDEKEQRAVESAYKAHLQAIRPRLPSDVKTLLETGVHDALIRRCVLDYQRQEVVLELRCGDVPRGYFDLDLLYSGVEMDRLSTERFSEVVRCPEAELLVHEIDMLKTRFVHRMLFFLGRRKEVPKTIVFGDLEIVFSELKLRRTNQRDRTFPSVEDKLMVISVPGV
jgi:hypothetical protein